MAGILPPSATTGGAEPLTPAAKESRASRLRSRAVAPRRAPAGPSPHPAVPSRRPAGATVGPGAGPLARGEHVAEGDDRGLQLRVGEVGRRAQAEGVPAAVRADAAPAQRLLQALSLWRPQGEE